MVDVEEDDPGEQVGLQRVVQLLPDPAGGPDQLLVADDEAERRVLEHDDELADQGREHRRQRLRQERP